jgi:plastocyanin
MKLTLPAAALCTALVAFGAAGCGSSNSSSSSSTPASSTPAPTPAPSGGGASSKLALSADKSGQLKFDKTSLSAQHGNVTIVLTNPAPVPHAISIEGNGVSKGGPTVQQGATSTVTASLKPGTYTFFCPVDGHRAAGMQGTLTVK